MDDEMSELKLLQAAAVGMHEAAIHTIKHRPKSASVAAGWAQDASLELYRFATKGETTQSIKQPASPEPTTGTEG